MNIKDLEKQDHYFLKEQQVILILKNLLSILNGFFIDQLKPVSVTFTDGVANVVESHIFERPKNARKWPTIKTLESTIGTIKGVEELTYNWKFGHSPEYKNSTSDNIHCLWKKERENRDTSEREDIRKILRLRRSYKKIYKTTKIISRCSINYTRWYKLQPKQKQRLHF